MLAPIVRAAAEQAPGTEFTMLSQQRFADLFADMPANVLFRGVELKKQSLPEIIRGLGAFEYVADMHDVIRSVVIRNALRLKGAKVVRIDKGRKDKWLLTHSRTHTPLKRTTERYWEVFEKIGIPKDPRKTLEIPSQMVRSGIGIAPFAAHEGKIYPIERMERVVELLSRKGERIVLFGGGKRGFQPSRLAGKHLFIGGIVIKPASCSRYGKALGDSAVIVNNVNRRKIIL